MKKSQAAMEFMYTYGWAVIAFLAVIITITNFFSGYIIDDSVCPPSYEFSSNALAVEDQKFLGSDVEFDPAKNLFSLILRNADYRDIIFTQMTIKKGEIVCGTISVPSIPIEPGENSKIFIGKLTNPICQGKTGECYNYDIEVKYTFLGSGLEHTSTGWVGGSFYAGGKLWHIKDNWVSNYTTTGNVINIQNRAGQPINFCNPETPPNKASQNRTVPHGTLYWDLPTGCATSGLTGVRFSLAQCNNRTQLSKGWLHNEMYLDDIFSGYKIYLSGNATYFDRTTSTNKTNGICLNDNLYFYINRNMVYYGGTIGYQGTIPSQFEAGDEAIRNCGRCLDIDASGWCIPAFELTTNGFIFGQYNDIDILIEDFCKGGTHAGGMSDLSFQLI